MKKFSVFNNLSSGIRQAHLLVPCGAIYYALYYILGFALHLGVAGRVLAFLVMLIGGISLSHMAIKILDKQPITAADYFYGYDLKRYQIILRYLGFTILYSVAVVFGCAALLVPGIYIILKWSLTPYIIIRENIGIFPAMKRSAQLTQGIRWKLLGTLASIALLYSVALAPLMFLAKEVEPWSLQSVGVTLCMLAVLWGAMTIHTTFATVYKARR